MSRQISRTQLIQENRIARTFLDGMIESCKNGLFQSAYEPLMDSRLIFSETCIMKRCNGELVDNKYGEKYKKTGKLKFNLICELCCKEQPIVKLGENKTLKTFDEINEIHGIEHLGNWELDKLENYSQILRNLYRMFVDNKELEPITNEEYNKAVEVYNKLIRHIDLINRGHIEILPTIIKEGKTMNFDEITQQIKDTKHNVKILFESLYNQFSFENIQKLIQCSITNEPRKRIQDLEKSMEIII